MRKQISRRDFLKGAAAGAVSMTAMGVLSACSSNAGTTTTGAPETTKAPETTAPETTVAETVSEPVNTNPVAEVKPVNQWLGTAPELGEPAETIEADVIVVGGGTGGQYVAASCADKGLSVIILEKNFVLGGVRDDIGAIGTKWQEKDGTKVDKAAAIMQYIMYSAHRVDQRLVRIWAEESGEALNWYGGLIESRGAGQLWHEGGYVADVTNPETHPKFPVGHSPKWNEGMNGSAMLSAFIEEKGGKIYTETPFQKFEYEGKKVTAAIAKDASGKVIRFVGKKGIVLATGGYQNNMEMMQALQADTTCVVGPLRTGGTAGDGIKACLWMGASMDEIHTSMLFDRGALFPHETVATRTEPTAQFRAGSQPFLKVNLKGERFANESGPYDFILHAAASQPGKCYCLIMDDNYQEHIKQFETVGCSRYYPYANGAPSNNDYSKLPDDFAGLIENGYLQKADTLEELAEKLNIPADTFAKTVKRYNELCDKGVDEDFFKDPYRMIALTKPPYYGVRLAGTMLCTIDGIRIDTKMRPVDADCEPFEGLHVIGDCSGNFFAHTYPNLFTGFANGRTLTFARRVSSILAGEEVKEYS